MFPTGTEEHEPLDERSWRKKNPTELLAKNGSAFEKEIFLS